MDSYFDSRAIGSSILGQVIVRSEPLEICLDLATVTVKPTAFMEDGKVFEDLVEQEFSGKDIFDNKYFKSDISKIPEYKGDRTDIRQILEILDNPQEEQETAIESAYIRKADGSLHGSYKQRHRCLDQIRAHDYRRPIPKPFWKKLWKMSDRTKAYPFEINGHTVSVAEWMASYVDVEFQVEYFWKHESGAECRAKFDMVWIWECEEKTYAMPFDLKVTANWPSFESNWKYKYIWQSKHYMEGFVRWCVENGCIPHPQIWYLIQESKEPFITHMRALSVRELDNLTEPYDEAILSMWGWIEAGRPVKGFVEQQTVDRWGRTE